PAEPFQDSSETTCGLRPRRITTGVPFHDFDGLRGAAIADVDASEDPPWAGHELRYVRVGPAAKRTTHPHTDNSAREVRLKRWLVSIPTIRTARTIGGYQAAPPSHGPSSATSVSRDT